MNAGSNATSFELASQLIEICRRLEWLPKDCAWNLDPAASLERLKRSSDLPSSGRECWLRWLQSEIDLLPGVRRLLKQQLHNGLTLVQVVSTAESSQAAKASSVNRLLGVRLYFMHRRLIEAAQPLVSLVCSRLGHGNCQLPDWPLIVNSILREISQHGYQLLVVPGTTLDEVVREFAAVAEIPTIEVALPDRKTSLSKWLLGTAGNSQADAAFSNKLFVSPVLGDCDPQSSSPLRDRCAVYLADHVYALRIRRSGVIAQLLRRRLRDEHLGYGATFVLMQPSLSSSRADAEAVEWLDRGAVGWYLPALQRIPRLLDMHRYLVTGCRQHQSATDTANVSASKHLHQLAAPLSSTRNGDSEWTFLTHCTRAAYGPKLDESEFAYRQRLWFEGREDEYHPLITLEKICLQRLLRGSEKLTRGSQACVSFSAVPLEQLLSRRVYRSHLSRWDWEPYGILIDRQTLADLGARPVIYGSQKDFEQLSAEDRPFFQSRGSTHDWTAEREWRIVGDLELSSLPQDSVRVFTETRQQAIRLATRHPWSVFWFE